MSAIRTRGLRKAYGSIIGLHGLDLEVRPRTVFGFLGPNGAGKTTTLRLLAGLSRPTAGEAWVAGEPVGPESPASRLVGYLPEEPRFYPWMTAAEFLGIYVAGLFGLGRRLGRQRAAEVLEQVGLRDHAQRRIGGFSRGMRQRLGLAQCLINGPQVLLLDEPVSALDPGGRRDMLELIGALKERGTVFMSTHILDDVERICDTVGVLHQGRMLLVEEREALLRRYTAPGVEVEFRAEAGQVEAWAERVRSQPGVLAVEVDGARARLRLDSAPDSGSRAQTLILGAGLPVERFQVARPTLEDVFLRLVEAA